MTKWVRTLVITNVIVYFIQLTVPWVTNAFMLIPVFLLHRPWTLVTYMFLHDPNSWSHILFNMIGLYVFGQNVEARLGPNRFITLYFLGGIAGGLASFVFAPYNPIVGASAAIYSVMIAYAMYWPRDRILIYFVIPVEIWLAVIIFAALDLYGGWSGGGTTAHFAHLGGLAAGFLYVKWLGERSGVKKFRKRVVEQVPERALVNWKRVDPKQVHEVNRDELNRILDKINRTGLGSLTPDEKRFLMSFVPPDDRPPMVS
jgi:membrane associated rhomboid family serine protease